MPEIPPVDTPENSGQRLNLFVLMFPPIDKCVKPAASQADMRIKEREHTEVLKTWECSLLSSCSLLFLKDLELLIFG